MIDCPRHAARSQISTAPILRAPPRPRTTANAGRHSRRSEPAGVSARPPGRLSNATTSDCVRIWKRFKHCDELFTFLDDPRVPADNNGCERDIRSLAAARNDGGVHRAEWSAVAFARIKSVIVTGFKNGVRFVHYGLEVVRAKLRGQPLPLPLATSE